MSEKQGKQIEISGDQPPSVGLMLHEMLKNIQAGQVTPQSVEVLKGMMDLYERNEARQAERDFNAAFAKLQSEVPKIMATKPVPNKDGSLRYKFAPYEEILAAVQPILTGNGFSVSFNSRFDNGRMISVCTLRHISGHSQANEFAVRIGGGPPGATETQADGAAKTYAKRGAFCDALNIAIDHDDDARAQGKPIGKALAEDLQARVKACGVNEEDFLKFAGAANFESISDDRFERLDEMLTRKEMGKGIRGEKGEYKW